MKTKEVIRLLQELDPSGDEEVCVGNVPIHFIEMLPACYDGPLQVLIRDEACRYYNVVGARYRRTGNKVKIHTHSITDAICENPEMPVDYSELRQPENAKAAHDLLRAKYREMENGLERKHFVAWAKQEAEKISEDTTGIEDAAVSYFDQHLDRSDPLPEGGVPCGTSYVQVRERQWSERFVVTLASGFLEIETRPPAPDVPEETT